MRRGPALYLGSWGLATVVATAITWAGVGIVTGDVTGEHTVALRPAEVDGLLDDPEPVPPSTTASSTSTSTTSTTAAPAPTSTSATVTTAATEPTPTTAMPTTTTSAPPATTTSTTRPPPPPPPPVQRTFVTRGGSVTASCERLEVSLVSARPNDGWTLRVLEDGPERVVVRFSSNDHDDGIGIGCNRGQPVELARPPHDGDRPPGADDGRP